MLAWFSFTLALMGAMFSLGALLSRDWIERQRLSFPLVQVPLAVTGDDRRPSLRKSILSNRVLWLGFGVPAVISILNWLNAIHPSVPAAPLSGIEVGRNFAGMALPWNVLSATTISILFPVVGISCLLPGEVSLSLWPFYAVLVGASRLVAAGGVMYVDTGVFPRGVMMRTVGAPSIGVTSLTLYAYLSVIHMYDPMNLAMPQMMNSFKLLHAGRLRGRIWPWATALSIVVMLVVGFAALLYVNHYYGGANRTWLYDYPQSAFGELEASLHEPEMPDNMLRLALLVGATFMLVLVWLNSAFVWWPLSPVGFIMASSWSNNWLMWGSVFIGWAVSTLVRRSGGFLFYRRMRPAFLGLILGDYLTRAALAGVSARLGIRAGVSYGW